MTTTSNLKSSRRGGPERPDGPGATPRKPGRVLRQDVRNDVRLQELVPERDDLAAFLEVGRAVDRDDPWHLPPARGTVETGVRRASFQGRQRAFVGFAHGRPAARVLARLHPELTGSDGRPVGMLGFFEAHDAPGPAEAVLAEGLAWLRRRGAGLVVGPMDGDTWHRYRLNLGPFDERPFLLEPYNPPRYAEPWIAAGFAPYADYSSLRVDDVRRPIDALAAGADRAARAGYELEPLEPRRFDAELDRIYDLTVRIFRDNLLYTEIPRRDFHALYGASRALVDPELIWLARSPDGADAGFVFAYPDLFEAVRAVGGNRGRRGPLARLRFLLHRRRADTVNLKTLGVLPEHRRSGLGAALMHRVYERALARGLRRANLCLILDGNPSARLDGGAGRVLRRYRLYAHELPTEPGGTAEEVEAP